MAHGLGGKATTDELHYLGEAFFGESSNELKHVALYHHVIDLLTAINDNRNERLDSSDGTVPTALWLVLLAGALITLGYPSFFGSSNITAQILMTASLAALVALTAFVALVLDYPFTGDVQISRAPFEQSLAGDAAASATALMRCAFPVKQVACESLFGRVDLRPLLA